MEGLPPLTAGFMEMREMSVPMFFSFFKINQFHKHSCVKQTTRNYQVNKED
jgi:hypothetical protein